MIEASPLSPKFESSSAPPRERSPSSGAAHRTVESVEQKSARVTERAEAHYERHRDKWVDTRFVKLLSEDPPAPSLKPDGAVENRAARLWKAAEYLAHLKHLRTIHKIENAASKLRGHSREEIGR